MRKPIIAGNWKMNNTPSDTKVFINSLKQKKLSEDVEKIIATPFTSLYLANELLNDTDIKLGAQNMYFEDRGAFTGEVSGQMLKDLNVSYVIIGHSERREIFNESDELLNKMSEWCVKTHTANGLVDRVKASKLTERAAELQTLDFLKRWVPKGASPICGNSIAQDKRFLYKYMPDLADYFHYRHLDVSTLKELAARWKPEILDGFKKGNTHLALDDIRESIKELAYYRDHFINLG